MSDERGPMERAVRKWDGDVFAGHEPEAWADLRLRAREQDALLRDYRAALEAAATLLEDYADIFHSQHNMGAAIGNAKRARVVLARDASEVKS